MGISDLISIQKFCCASFCYCWNCEETESEREFFTYQRTTRRMLNCFLAFFFSFSAPNFSNHKHSLKFRIFRLNAFEWADYLLRCSSLFYILFDHENKFAVSIHFLLWFSGFSLCFQTKKSVEINFALDWLETSLKPCPGANSFSIFELSFLSQLFFSLFSTEK